MTSAYDYPSVQTQGGGGGGGSQKSARRSGEEYGKAEEKFPISSN